ncbi:MAG: hydrolase [Patescibacteria group bacterium]|jgi:hypothetical protein
MTNQNDVCCPEFHPARWDGKTHEWYNKPFIKETVPTFFHIPFPPMIGQKIVKMMKLAEASNSIDADKENVLILFRDPSAFKSEIYFSVTSAVPTANNTTISGSFVSKTFAGGYNAIPKFIKEMDEYLAKEGKKAKDYYIHYAYCPKCAKKFGNNYMILFAQI